MYGEKTWNRFNDLFFMKKKKDFNLHIQVLHICNNNSTKKLKYWESN